MLHVHQPEPADRLEYARQIIRAEAAALECVASRLDASFERAVELFLPITLHGRGRAAITGTGKSADIGLKLSGTLNSTGTRAYVLDATKAMHGDLGMLHPDDVAVVLSHSGESEEIVRLLRPLRELSRAIVALTGNAGSTLAQGGCGARLWAAGRGVPARPRAQRQHDGHAGDWGCAVVCSQPTTRI